MRRSTLALAAILALAGGGASAQSPAPAMDLNILSCAAFLSEAPPIPVRRLVPAFAGLMAARAGNARLPSDAEIARFGTALQAGCRNDTTRPVAMIAGLTPPPGGGEHDLAVMTCAALAPLWRHEAEQIVPFIAGLLARQGRLEPGAMDRIGNGLQAACRQPANAGQNVLNVVALLP